MIASRSAATLRAPRADDPLEQAIAWKLEHDAAALPPQRQAAFQAWLDATTAHRHAWHKLEQMDASLAHLDSPARNVLAQHRRTRSVARHAVHATLALLLTVSAVMMLHAYRPLSALTADYAAATATPRQVTLPDGSQLYLDARSAVDIAFSDKERLVQLRSGTILIQTARDPAQRPFIVESPHGRLRALGTRFLVDDDGTATQLTVLQHAVQANATAPDRQAIVHTDQALRLAPGTPFIVTSAPADADAWVDGMLVVHDAPLESVLRQFGRYRYGHLRVDPDVAQLPVSGTFSLRDTDRSLRALASQLPIRIRQFSGLWVEVLPDQGRNR